MISTPNRQTAVVLIKDAVTSGARRAKACAELEISDRTLRRWTKDGRLHADKRPFTPQAQAC
jgi:transposase-like protein